VNERVGGCTGIMNIPRRIALSSGCSRRGRHDNAAVSGRKA
jgi:hypothetical protein